MKDRITLNFHVYFGYDFRFQGLLRNGSARIFLFSGSTNITYWYNRFVSPTLLTYTYLNHWVNSTALFAPTYLYLSVVSDTSVHNEQFVGQVSYTIQTQQLLREGFYLFSPMYCSKIKNYLQFLMQSSEKEVYDDTMSTLLCVAYFAVMTASNISAFGIGLHRKQVYCSKQKELRPGLVLHYPLVLIQSLFIQ